MSAGKRGVRARCLRCNHPIDGPIRDFRGAKICESCDAELSAGTEASRLKARTENGVTLAPDRENVRRYALQYVALARLARKAGHNPQRIARDQLDEIGKFMAGLPESERDSFQEMLAEAIERAHAASH